MDAEAKGSTQFCHLPRRRAVPSEAGKLPASHGLRMTGMLLGAA